jgi:hypothetical protein
MRHVIAARHTSHSPRTVRIVRYTAGWDITVGIGGPDPDQPARAAAVLDPDQAAELAAALQRAAADGAAIRSADAA